MNMTQAQPDLFPVNPVLDRIMVIGNSQERFTTGYVICSLNGGCWGGRYRKDVRATVEEMVSAGELIEHRVYYGDEKPGSKNYRGFGHRYELRKTS